MATIRLAEHKFEGPLDLLLTLIEGQKLDITKVALATVTEQFLQYIRTLEFIDPTTLSDFLSIAAKLLVIKSKAILPTLAIEIEDEDDPGQNLEERLILYRQFKEAAKFLKVLDAKRQQSFTRVLSFEERIHFFPDTNVTKEILHSSILGILENLKELDNLPKAKIKEAISIQEKIDHLQVLISHQLETNLSTLLSSAKNKSEVIITFLALLELIKQKVLTVEQEALFTEVTIKKYTKLESYEENNHE